MKLMKGHLASRHEEFARRANAYWKALDPEQRPNLEGPGTSSLAAWFLGPKAENRKLFSSLVQEAIDAHCDDREDYFDDPPYITAARMDDAYRRSVEELKGHHKDLLDQLKGSVPFFGYRYQAHMNWDLTMPGMLGYFAAMLYNQNNVALEAAPVTAHLEVLVGRDLCRMLGFPVSNGNTRTESEIKPWGHVTCDGSVANLEAAWASRNLKYYPVSFAEALRNEQDLLVARDLEVELYDRSRGSLVDLEPWQLLNLPIDAVLALPQRLRDDYQLEQETIENALRPYLLQTKGFVQFSRDYLGSTAAPVLLGSATKHYSWPKNAAILGVGNDSFINVAVDSRARMDTGNLRAKLETILQKDHPRFHQPVLMVVVVLGSTEESAVDPLAEVLSLRDEFRKEGLEFPVHVDGAWGGYFATILREPVDDAEPDPPADSDLQVTPALQMSDYATAQYERIPEADSVTIDPHKAAYIPYPAGGLCYRNSAMRNLVAFNAPEVYHGEDEPTSSIYSVEGSKPGASTAAVYLSHRVIRPDRSGYGKILGQALWNSKRFYAAVVTLADVDDDFIVVPVQELPAEAEGGSQSDIDRQLGFIRERIVRPENNAIVADPEAYALLKRLGSDQIIITYAFNFRRAGELNRDPEAANKFNKDIFKELSLSPGHKAQNTPLIITMSEFDPAVYGSSFVQNFMLRLGVEGEPQTMYFISSTTMSPWLTATRDGNFIPVLAKAFRKAILKQVPGRNLAREVVYQ